jgi:hypothetical protein
VRLTRSGQGREAGNRDRKPMCHEIWAPPFVTYGTWTRQPLPCPQMRGTWGTQIDLSSPWGSAPAGAPFAPLQKSGFLPKWFLAEWKGAPAMAGSEPVLQRRCCQKWRSQWR